MGEAGPVGIAQQLAPHVPGQLQRRHLRPRAGDAGQGLAQPGQEIERAPALADQLAIEQRRQLPRHEQAAPQQVGVAEIAAVFEQAGIFRRGEAAEHRGADLAEGAAHPGDAAQWRQPANQRRNLLEAGITAEQLVAAQAGQRHLQSRAGSRLADQIAVDPVDRRLIHGVEQPVLLGLELGGADPAGAMLGAVARGADLGQPGLVPLAAAIFRKAQRDGAQPRPHRLGRQAHQGIGIDAGRQEEPDRNVGLQMMLHAVEQGVVDQPLALRRVGRRWPGGRLGELRGDVEIAGQPHAAIVDGERVAGRQRPDLAIEREGLRHVAEQEKSDSPGGVGRQVEAAAGLERLDLRGEAQHPRPLGKIERPDAEGIAGGEQAAPRLVPDGEGEHAAKPRDHLGAIAGIEQQQHLGIGGRATGDALPGQLGAQLSIVEDLAIEDDPIAALIVAHRLVGLGPRVDDRQPPVGEADPAVR